MLQKKGLLGALQDNMSFHYATMQHFQIHEISTITKKWFEEVINTRYAFRQFSRIDAESRGFLLNRLHVLDIRLVRGLLENYKVFYKNGTKSSLSIEEQYAYLYTNYKLCCDLRKQRDHIIEHMKVDLDNYYKKSRFVNFFKKILKIFQ
jgi:hypothetical protein